MEVISSPNTLISQLSKTNQTIGFVPTMGALHEGHLSLVRRSKQDNDLTVVSIFLNPAQFAPHEDLDTYPAPLQEDLKLLSELDVNIVFCPTRADIFPEGL